MYVCVCGCLSYSTCGLPLRSISQHLSDFANSMCQEERVTRCSRTAEKRGAAEAKQRGAADVVGQSGQFCKTTSGKSVRPEFVWQDPPEGTDGMALLRERRVAVTSSRRGRRRRGDIGPRCTAGSVFDRARGSRFPRRPGPRPGKRTSFGSGRACHAARTAGDKRPAGRNGALRTQHRVQETALVRESSY